MKNILALVLAGIIVLSACSKAIPESDPADNPGGATSTAAETAALPPAETTTPPAPGISPPVVSTGEFVSVSAGNAHSLAIDNKGRLWAWGSNAFGQIGDGKVTTYYDNPFCMKNGRRLAQGNFNPKWDGVADEDIPIGYDHDRDKEFDHDVYSPKIIMENVKFAVARRGTSFAITNDNKLYAWGENFYGQLGDGTNISKTIPTFIMDNVKYVDSNGRRSLFIKTDDSLWLSKYEDGRDENDWWIVVPDLPELIYENVQKAVFDRTRQIIYNGREYSALAILTVSGEVISYIETRGSHGNAGFYSFTNIVDISSGVGQQIFILDKNGNVTSMGANGADGSLGIGISGSRNGGDEAYWWRYDFNPVDSNVRKLLSGAMFIKNNGTLYVWGDSGESFSNKYISSWLGSLIENGLSPVPVLNNVVTAEQGGHYIALDVDGNVYTWGQNFHGQLGHRDNNNRTEPTVIVFK
jgi:alpha-tubulin suppressor-like RCC1 family protein